MNTCPWCGEASEHEYLNVKDYFLSQESFTVYACDHCGLLFTAPRPDSQHLGDYYKSDKYYSHQENKKGLIPRIYESVKSVNLKHKVRLATQGLSLGTVLDIGCGVGDFLYSMKAERWKIVGIEPDLDAQSIAEKRLGIRPLSPEQSCELPSSSFDLITLWHVFEHVDDLHRQLDELERLLKPGGRLLIALPNFQSFDAQYYQQYWAAWDVPRHLNHFSEDCIHSIVTSKSFQYIDTHRLIWDSYYISYLSETYMKHPLPLLRGFFSGMRSNLRARKSGQYSSLVYLFKKV